MASHLGRTMAKSLYSLAARGSSRTWGPASAKANCYSTTTTTEDESNDASRDEASPESHEQELPDAAATAEFFSFDSPASPDTADAPAASTPSSEGGVEQPYTPSHNVFAGRAYQPRGVYKAILLGEVGQPPAQKILKSGRAVTIFSVGTGGMHLNRRMFDGETPEEFAERSNVQWHRVAVYQEKLGHLILQSMKQGSQVYVEGNLETRIYNEPNSEQVKRIREIAVRNNGRLLFMDAASTAKESPENPLETLEPITRQPAAAVEAPMEA